jgi:sugar lactone lactonase YvrE
MSLMLLRSFMYLSTTITPSERCQAQVISHFGLRDMRSLCYVHIFVFILSGVSTLANVMTPRGIALASSGLLYVAANNQIVGIRTNGSTFILAGDYNQASGFINGQGTNARFRVAGDLALPPTQAVSILGERNMYVTDINNHVVRVVNVVSGLVTSYAGSPSGLSGFVDGAISSAVFNIPLGITISTGGWIFIADQRGGAVRMISTSGIVTTVAGSATLGQSNGFGTQAIFTGLKMIALSTSGDQLYLSDYNTNRISILDLTGYCPAGEFASLRGVAGSCVASPAGYYKPRAAFSDNYYVCPNGTYSSSGASACTTCWTSTTVGASSCPPTPMPTAVPSTLPTATPTSTPTVYCAPGMVRSSSNVCSIVSAGQYASASTNHQAVNCSSSTFAGAANCITAVPFVSSVAGGRATAGLFDGIGTQVRFDAPQAVTVDRNGNVYITDTVAFNIRVMNNVTGAVTTLAGKFEVSGNQYGDGTNARFIFPYSIVIGTDSSTLYVADQGANNIRTMTTSGNVMSALISGQTFQGIAMLPSGTIITTTGTHTIYSLPSLGEYDFKL